MNKNRFKISAKVFELECNGLKICHRLARKAYLPKILTIYLMLNRNCTARTDMGRYVCKFLHRLIFITNLHYDYFI